MSTDAIGLGDAVGPRPHEGSLPESGFVMMVTGAVIRLVAMLLVALLMLALLEDPLPSG